MKNEKAKTPARKAATEKKRPAPVGGTSGEPVAADNGKRTRPTFVPDAIFEELTGEELKDYFEPSPCLYDCACLHLAEESAFAYKHGDNDLLSRDGVADALAFIANPYNANPFKDRDGGGHYPEMLEEWREDCQDELATLAAFRYIQTDDDKLLRRLDFLRWFDTSGKPDKETMEMRAAFLERHTERGNAIRYLMRARGDGKSDFDKQVDRFIDGLFEPRTVAPPPDGSTRRMAKRPFCASGQAAGEVATNSRVARLCRTAGGHTQADSGQLRHIPRAVYRRFIV